MPKRPNPFGDCSPLQFKARIGKKEVDLGVCAEANMQSVYAKTKSMMFEAARQGTDITPQMDMDASDSPNPPVPSAGQLRIDSCGKLCTGNDQQMDTGPSFAAAAFGGCKLNTTFNNNNYTSMPASQSQLKLNSKGGLVLGFKKKSNPFHVIASTRIQCNSCRIMSQSLQSCAFCEKLTCINCLRPCDGCQGKFCHVCSVLNYTDCMERAFCLQCSS